MKDSYKTVKQVLWIILFVNLTVAVLKIIIGTIIKSTSMTADGFHSLTDGSSNIIGLIGIHFACIPEDEDHPYGHRKFEILAGLFISVLLFILGGKTVINAVDTLRNPVVPDITLESLIILLMTLCINIFISVFEYRKGKKLNSQILICDSAHTRSDIYVSAGVLFTLICIKAGMPPVIDPIASFIVAGFIFHSAYEIFKDNSSVLVDKAVVDTDKIRSIALGFEQVKDAHDIRSRGCENDVHIDMHIMTEPDLSVEKSHELIHDIEERIKEEINKNAQLIVHIEPFNSGNDNNN